MSRSEALLGWLDARSDWLSPIVVKEVRQIVRGRDFAASFAASLIGGVAVAFFGAADALTGSTAGGWIFSALMSCLAILGLAVVPLGAFNALRNERLEQTLDLITLTALSPRRIVIGKLLAQGVKLMTLFAAMAPFIAMSFLLGGIDFVTIVVSLAVLYFWSLWACAVCLFLSSLFKSRAMFGIVFGGLGVIMFLGFGIARSVLFSVRFSSSPVFFGTGPGTWWILCMVMTFCVVTMSNLVLLAENRLSLPSDNKVAPLRVGFLVQFLALSGWVLSFITEPQNIRSNAVDALGALGGLHLALVAVFAVTEDLTVSRRTLLRMKRSAVSRWLTAIVRPGGGNAALYVLVQMSLMFVVAWALGATPTQHRWMLAVCGYICLFVGVPAAAMRYFDPRRPAAIPLRVAVLVLVFIALTLPDTIHYMVWQPEVLDLQYSTRHLINPFRTLANWRLIERNGWWPVPIGLGLIGVAAFLSLIVMGARVTRLPLIPERRSPAAAPDERGSADVLY